MKWIFITMSVLVISCSGNSNNDKPKVSKAKNIDSVIANKQPIIQIQEKKGDTTYKIGDFLFTASKNMKFDFIDSKHPLSKITSKGDTLYHDNKNTILGDYQELKEDGVYKKYHSHFDFQMFKVDSLYAGRLAIPDFKTDKNANEYRTRIKEGCKGEGVNFAGHYTIIEWGCGTECREMAIVNRKNGKIYYSIIPFDTSDGYYGCDYKRDSRIIKVNTYLLEDHPGYCLYRNYQKPCIYLFTDSTFKKLE